MHKIKLNFGELMVKIFYILLLITYVVTLKKNLNNNFNPEAFIGYYVLINILLIYVFGYSCYFLFKYRNSEYDLKIEILKKSRQVSLIATIFLTIQIYILPIKYSLVNYVIFVIATIIIIVMLINQMIRSKKQLNKAFIWLD